MAIFFLDSFDDRLFSSGSSYATYHAKWNTVDEDSAGGYLLTQVTGRTGKACQLGGVSFLQKTNINSSSLGWGLGLKVTSTPVSETTIVEIECSHAGGTGYIRYKLTTNLTIKVYQDNTNFSESNSSISTNVFYYIEAHANTGTYTSSLYKDGSSWLTLATTLPVAWSEATVTNVKFMGGVTIDDLYLSDDSNFTSYFPISIYALIPNSDGAARVTNPWQTTSYTSVDECYQTNHDGDTTLNTSSTSSPSSISYNFQDKTDITLKAIQSMSWVGAYQSGGSPASIGFTAITKISSTDYLYSVGLNLTASGTTSFSLLRGIWQKSPATNSDWTQTELNNAEFGVKVDNVNADNVGRLTAITIEAFGYTPGGTRYFIIS